MRKIILLTAVVYFLIAPFTYHPDTKLTLRYPALENNKVWDIYGYIYNHKLDIPDFHYPPAHFWWLKIHYPISKFLGGNGFDKWLSSGSAQASFDVNAFRYNLAAKFPLLVLGLLCGWLIFLIVKKSTADINKAKMAALLWYFNPITLYSLVIMGQNDIVAIFLFLVGMLLYEKWWLTAMLWGLASGVKSYPIIWSIMFLLVWEKNIYKLILKSVSVVAVYGLILLPWLGKSYFMEAVMNSGLSQRMFIANIPIGFDKEILIVPFLLIVAAFNAWKNNGKNKMFWANFFVFLSSLIILGFSHFNPQWLLWTVPFLSIWWSILGVSKDEVLPLLIIFVVWGGLTLGFDDKFLTWGLVTPISPNLINFPSLVELAKNKSLSLSSIINLCQTTLAGISVWYLVRKIVVKKTIINKIKIKNWMIGVPWILVMTTVLLLSSFKVENKTYAITEGGREVYLSEIDGKQWQYVVNSNLKYLEISLDNPGLNSEDKGVLIVTDKMGNKIEKDFSGFNSGADGWLRVDLPGMTGDGLINLEVKDVAIKDGLLKIRMDNENRWAVNFYNWEKPSMSMVINKLLAFWWWWLTLGLLSAFFIKVKED